MPGPRGGARRYAEAAFEIGRRDGTLDKWLADLQRANEILGGDIQRPLDNPAVPFGEKRAAIEKLLAGEVSRPVLNLLLLLVERDRVRLLPAVVEEYIRRLDEERGIIRANVTSALALDAPEIDGVRRRLEELTASRVELTTNVDPSLIGGLTVQVGDRLIDASVRGRLERLRARLVADAG